MVRRIQNINTSHSLFLFGARGVGKSTLLKEAFSGRDDVFWIDLLRDEDEELYRRTPSYLSDVLNAGRFRVVVIDEVQKNPKLLDLVHLEIEKKRGVQFILSGSSARKLRRGGANLLGGRAFTFELFPLTHHELDSGFSLEHALEFGTLPQLLEYSAPQDKLRYLRSYTRMYLKEEILTEQIVRNITPFARFLEIAAQMNGRIVNFAAIARDVGADAKTVKAYFDVLTDTLIGSFLPSFHRSVRKLQRQAPKFYLFDTGVRRALDITAPVRLVEGSYEYGNAFEHFVILEFIRLNSYLERGFRFSYLRTKDDAEIDLIIERPGLSDLLIEIKSSPRVDAKHAIKLSAFAKAWGAPAEALLLSRDPNELLIEGVRCLPWNQALGEIFSLR